MAHPDYDPQLATLVKTPPSGDEWLHEIKFDGYRIGCRIGSGGVSLYTRNGKDWTAAFPAIAAAAQKLATTDALLDGEIAVIMPDGRTSFQGLQNTSGVGEQAIERSRRVPDVESHGSGATRALPHAVVGDARG